MIANLDSALRATPTAISRMAKTTSPLEVVAPDAAGVDPALKTLLPELAAQIRETQASARRHAKLAIVFHVRQGLLCEQAKKELPRGSYEPWLLAQGIGKMSAHRDRLLAKSNTMLLLAEKPLTAPNFVERVENDRTFRDELAAAVETVAGEATMTEVMTDLGILQRPKNIEPETGKRRHYPAQAKAKEKSREQIEKENRAASRKMFLNAFAGVKAATANKQARRFLTAEDWVYLAKVGQDHFDALNKVAAQARAALAKGKK